MARIGINPARNRVTTYRPARVTAAVLVYIPYLEGYFRHRLDVLKLCLGSLIKNTYEPYDLLIFDNGSCDEVKEFLHNLLDRGAFHYLLTSNQNIGKVGALKIMFRAVPGEVIAYCDDDIFFYPGWLSEHLKLLDAFPNVGMVSGCAVTTLFDHGTKSNLRLVESDPEVNLYRGHQIPELWEREWAESYGRDPEEHLEAIRSQEDMIIERRAVRAFAIANHNQFVTPKLIISEFLPAEWSGRLMGEMNELDNAVDDGGYLRLSTIERTTKHMGNMVSPAMAEEAGSMGISVEDITRTTLKVIQPGLSARIIQWKPIRWLLQGIYNRLFWLLAQQSGDWLVMTEADEK